MARATKTRAGARKAARSSSSTRTTANDTSSIEHARALADGYLESLRVEQNASEHTIRGYATDIDAYLRWCERTSSDPLHANHRELRAYLGELDAARYKRTTINRHLSAIKGYYRWLVIQGAIDSDPASVAITVAELILQKLLELSDLSRLLVDFDAFVRLKRHTC